MDQFDPKVISGPVRILSCTSSAPSQPLYCLQESMMKVLVAELSPEQICQYAG